MYLPSPGHPRILGRRETQAPEQSFLTLREKADGYLKGLYEQRLVDRAGGGPAFSVEPPAEKKEAGKVESQGDFVVIGGMKVPRRGA